MTMLRENQQGGEQSSNDLRGAVGGFVIVTCSEESTVFKLLLHWLRGQ